MGDISESRRELCILGIIPNIPLDYFSDRPRLGRTPFGRRPACRRYAGTNTSVGCLHILFTYQTQSLRLSTVLKDSRIEEYTKPFKVVDAAKDGTWLRPCLRQPHCEPIAVQVRRLSVDLELDLDDPVLRGERDARPQPPLARVGQLYSVHHRQEGTICEGRSRVRRTCLLVF